MSPEPETEAPETQTPPVTEPRPPRRTFLVIAESGLGKTTLAGTFPGRKFFLDFDNQIEATFSPERFGRDIWYVSLGDALPIVQVDKAPATGTSRMAWERGCRALELLSRGETITLNMLGVGPVEFSKPDYIVIDSYTSMAKAALRARIHAAGKDLNPTGILQQYGTASLLMDRIVECLGQFPCSMIINAHDKLTFDAEAAVKKWEVIKWGKAGDSQMGGFFSEVWRIRTFRNSDGELYRGIQTVATPDAWAKTHLAGVGPTVRFELGKQTAATMLAADTAARATAAQPPAPETQL